MLLKEINQSQIQILVYQQYQSNSSYSIIVE